MMDSDVEGLSIPSPALHHGSGNGGAGGAPVEFETPKLKDAAQHGGKGGVFMSPPPPPSQTGREQPHGGGMDPALNHQLSADGSCAQQPLTAGTSTPAVAVDATVSGTTPFSNAYFANAAANGLHISPASTMTRAQVTQVSKAQQQQYHSPHDMQYDQQYGRQGYPESHGPPPPPQHYGRVSAYVSVPMAAGQTGGYEPPCTAKSGKVECHNSYAPPPPSQQQEHPIHRRDRNSKDGHRTRHHELAPPGPSGASRPPPYPLTGDGGPPAAHYPTAAPPHHPYLPSRKRKSSKRSSSAMMTEDGAGEASMGPPPPWQSSHSRPPGPSHPQGEDPHSYRHYPPNHPNHPGEGGATPHYPPPHNSYNPPPSLGYGAGQSIKPSSSHRQRHSSQQWQATHVSGGSGSGPAGEKGRPATSGNGSAGMEYPQTRPSGRAGQTWGANGRVEPVYESSSPNTKTSSNSFRFPRVWVQSGCVQRGEQRPPTRWELWGHRLGPASAPSPAPSAAAAVWW